MRVDMVTRTVWADASTPVFYQDKMNENKSCTSEAIAAILNPENEKRPACALGGAAMELAAAKSGVAWSQGDSGVAK